MANSMFPDCWLNYKSFQNFVQFSCFKYIVGSWNELQIGCLVIFLSICQKGKCRKNQLVVIILINQVILAFLLKVSCLCFLKCISAVTLLSISFSIASPREQQSYSFYNNAGNNHIARGFSFTHCDENSLALVEKFEGFSLEFGLKTCKLPEATKHQNLQKLAQNFYIGFTKTRL